MDECVKKWTRDLKKEMRTIDRETTKIQREEQKIKQELKKEAKAGNKKSVQILAKAVVKSQNQREKMLLTKTQLNSVAMTLKQQYSSMKVAKTMEKSAVIMQHMNRLVSVQQISAVTRNMSKEMMKMGIIDEMVQEAFEDMEDEELEEEAEEQVNAVIDEITAGILGKEEVGTKRLNQKEQLEAKDKEKDLDAGLAERLDML